MADHDPLSTQEILQTDAGINSVELLLKKQSALLAENIIASKEEAARLACVETLKKREIELSEALLREEQENKERLLLVLERINKTIDSLSDKPFDHIEQKINAIIAALRVLTDLVLGALGRDIRSEDKEHLQKMYHLFEQTLNNRPDVNFHNTNAGHDANFDISMRDKKND